MDMIMENDRYFILNTKSDFIRGVCENTEFEKEYLSLKIGAGSGYFISYMLDCLENGNKWRRVFVDGDFPIGTQVIYTFYVTNHLYLAESISSVLDDKNLSIEDKLSQLKPFAAKTISNAVDFLLTGVEGRYLFLQVELIGHMDIYPKIKSLQIYSSQETLTQYLPELFREDYSFLDRFLRILSVQYIGLENTISSISRRFNASIAEEDMLFFLAELMSIENIQLFNKSTLRKLLLSNVYRKKGVLSALTGLIEIYTSYRPYIIESFRALPNISDDGVKSSYGENTVIIILPSETIDSANTLQALHTLIEDFIPVNTLYRLIILKNAVILSHFTYLGINSYVNNYEAAEINSSKQLPYIILGDGSLEEH